MKVSLDASCKDIGVDGAEIDHVLGRIESGHQIAAIANGEIGENVGALPAEQKLLAVTTDKIRLTGARHAQMRRHITVAQERRWRRPAGGTSAWGPRDHIRRWSDVVRKGLG